MNNTPISARTVAEPKKRTHYPEPYATLVEGRTKRKLGDFFGLTNFGVNLTQLAPGAISALLHCHSKQDEFIYILEGMPTLVLGDREFQMGPGDCFGFKAGTEVAHQLVNRSDQATVYIEIGDRSKDDVVVYPNDDIAIVLTTNGPMRFTHKDGTPFNE